MAQMTPQDIQDQLIAQEREILSLRAKLAESQRQNANLRLQNRTLQYAIDALERKYIRQAEAVFGK